MKKTAFLMSVIMLLTLFSGTVIHGTTIVDSSEDGCLSWHGYNWTSVCVPEEYPPGTSMSYAEACPHDWMFVDDENQMNFIMHQNYVEQGRFHMIEIPNGQASFTENFDVEFDMKMTEYGGGLGFQIHVPYMRLYSEFESRGFRYQGNNGIKLFDMAMDNEWHNWRFEVREDKYTAYRDGQVFLTDELQITKGSNSNSGDVRFYSTPALNIAPKAQMRNFAVTNYENYIGMTPKAESTFNVGDNVTLRANVSDGAEYVTYYVGQVAIGTATAENNYEYILESPAVGTYKVWAKTSTGKETFSRTFAVASEKNAEVVCVKEVSLGETAVLSLNNINADISRVDYYINGSFAGTSYASPYSAEVSFNRVGSSLVYARVLLCDGSYITTDTEIINVKTEYQGNYEVSREYDLSYTVKDEGNISVCDGYFKLSFSHSGNILTYITREGSKDFNGGEGDYRIIASAGIADVYKDGQLAFSYYMPRSSEPTGMAADGVMDVVLSGSGVKTTVYEREISGEEQFTDENINMGLFYSLEFDKNDTSSESILLYDGEYKISLNFNGGIMVYAQPETGGKIIEQKLAEDIETGYYRLTIYRGIANLFVDNNYIGAFRAPKEAGRKTLRKVMSNPTATTFVSIKNTDDIFRFEDDFSGNGQREPLEYWYRIYGNTAGVVENEVLRLSGDGTYLLDATAENPTLKWKMTAKPIVTEPENTTEGMVSEGDKTTVTTIQSGEFAIGIRYRNEYNNLKLKYSFSDKKWTLAETVGGTATVISERTWELLPDESYVFKLEIKEDILKLSCDDECIFENIPLTFLGNGKVGFSLSGMESLILDDVSYVGNGKVNSGVNYSFWTESQVNETVEFIDGTEDGEILFSTLDGMSKRQVYSTTDDGETWKGPVENSLFKRNSLRLQSGRVLRIAQGSGLSHATLYEADGETIATDENGNYIAKYTAIQSTDDVSTERFTMPGRILQTRKVWGTATDAAPRVLYVLNEGTELSGDITVFYSDDEGKTWTQTSTVLTYASMGNFYGGEPDIVDLPDDRVRIYFRGDRGFLHYTDSYDGGVTFGYEPIPSQFMTPSTCFAIDRDPDAESTYYMIWEYDITTAHTSYIQTPRNREAIAVSYDGCENWEYIMEMDDQGSKKATNAHMNANIKVINGKVCVNHSYIDALQYSENEIISNIVYVLDPKKINPVKRFANAHYVEPDFKTIYDYLPSQAVISKHTGSALIYGSIYPSSVNNDGLVQSELVAKVLGAELVKTADGVELHIGDGVVSFTKGEASYKINGEASLSATVCLSEDGDYLDTKLCAEIFGRKFVETESSYLILDKMLLNSFISELEALAMGVPEKVRLCIEEFKNISDASEIKKFFKEYKMLLNLNVDLGDKSYENMFNAYSILSVEEIETYEELKVAIDTLVSNENAKIEQFLKALNEASQRGDATAIQTYMTEDYADLLSIEIDLSEVLDIQAVFRKMTGTCYGSVSEVERVYRATFDEQKYVESGNANSVILSTVSRGFDNWIDQNSGGFGGVTVENGEENIATLSAYEGKKYREKDAVWPPISVVTYQSPGVFGNNIKSSGVTVDKGKGLVSFGGNGDSFLIEGTKYADSRNLCVVFDMTKPTDEVNVIIKNGVYQGEFALKPTGTSFGEYAGSLADAEKVTYRADITLSGISLYAKPFGATDTEYILLGDGKLSSIPKAKWSLNFESDTAIVEISEIGIYSALSSVRYDIGGMTLCDDISYSANGASGHTMNDLIAINGVISGNVYVDEESGNLVLSKVEGEGNAVIMLSENNGMFREAYDRAEINITVSVETGADIYLYMCDNSGVRYKSNMKPSVFNKMSTGVTQTWTSGQFYDVKLLTEVVGYDDNGQARTSASMYIKKTEDAEWICVAQDMVLTEGQVVNTNHINLFNRIDGTKVEISDIEIKTYTKADCDVEYANTTVTIPQADYNFSFEYKRLDNTPTVFSIGGEDYCQKFEILPFHISSDTTRTVVADVDVKEDTWYRFYGKVEVTEETPLSSNKAKTLKNTITMYMEDADGNVTVLFEGLPMLKELGSNGIKFGMYETQKGGARIKNVRIYSGKALDFVTSSLENGSGTVCVDFLNDETVITDVMTVYAGIYNQYRLVGAKSCEIDENPGTYSITRFVIDDIPCSAKFEDNASFRVFLWDNFVPITSGAERKYQGEKIYNQE